MTEQKGGWSGRAMVRHAALPIGDGSEQPPFSTYLDMLHESERAHWRTLHGVRGTEWLLGRIAIKESVCAWQQHVGQKPEALHHIQVRVNNAGAPWVQLRDQRAPAVSLTHARPGGSPGIVLAAVADPGTRVGIDVESRHRRSSNLLRALSDRERRHIGQDLTGVDLLVAKEAAAKATGKGLGGSLGRWPVLDRSEDLVLVGTAQGDVLQVQLYRHEQWVIGLCQLPGVVSRP